eukprot:1136203-Pelagomonas_calceolata.AAC.6
MDFVHSTARPPRAGAAGKEWRQNGISLRMCYLLFEMDCAQHSAPTLSWGCRQKEWRQNSISLRMRYLLFEMDCAQHSKGTLSWGCKQGVEAEQLQLVNVRCHCLLFSGPEHCLS